MTYNISLFLLLLVVSVILSVQDIKHLSVKNWIIFSGCILALLVHFCFNSHQLYLYLISSGLFVFIYFLAYIFSKNKLGKADIYFGFFQGMFLLPQSVWLCVLLEVIFAFLWFCVIGVKIKKLPFIPFMSLASLIIFALSMLPVNLFLI